jgi:hypothetical protein
MRLQYCCRLRSSHGSGLATKGMMLLQISLHPSIGLEVVIWGEIRCRSGLEPPPQSCEEPGAWGYNWATLSLRDINTETWPSRLGVGRNVKELLLQSSKSQTDGLIQDKFGRTFLKRPWAQKGLFCNGDDDRGTNTHRHISGSYHKVYRINNALNMIFTILMMKIQTVVFWSMTLRHLKGGYLSFRRNLLHGFTTPKTVI